MRKEMKKVGVQSNAKDVWGAGSKQETGEQRKKTRRGNKKAKSQKIDYCNAETMAHSVCKRT